MKDLLIKYPILYLLLFCLLAGVAGVESGDIIKNGLPEQKGVSYLRIFGIIINFILSFCFLFTFVKIKNKKENDSK
ncbi:MAG: hypothetical protein QMC07_09375 [Flavobacteriaceae bacterium]